ncbi:MAG: glycosyltransferase family 39 protein [Candidatus Microthrix sp.]|uniref:Glycosyltransferase family 39 protein n=1 Tax=Candidatus Neomicrothrix subdominans TaxID=2954438 RepID=A0A936TDT4_9ACTN|nr:glycosyltransferase family 39 protein [Candidatus Microthrix subdominans]
MAEPVQEPSVAPVTVGDAGASPAGSDAGLDHSSRDPLTDGTAGSDGSFHRRLLMITAAGLVLRLVWVLIAARQPVGLTDPMRYLTAGRDIALGNGYVDFSTGQPTAYYPPGYPLFVGAIAAVLRPFGLLDNWLPQAVALVQACLGAASIYLLGLLGRSLWSRKVGLVAALILALYPNLVMHTAGVLGETLYIFLLVAALYVLLAVPFSTWSLRQGVLRAGGFGLLFGLAALVRPLALPALVVLVIVWLRGRDGRADDGDARSWDRRSALRWSAVAIVATGAVIGAWTVRNVVRMDEPVLISTNTGDNLCIGHTSQATGGFHLRPGCVAEAGDVADGTAAEVAHDKELTKRAIRWTIDNPGEEPRLMVSRIYHTFHADDDAVLVVQNYIDEEWLAPWQEGALRIAANGAYALVAIGGLVALFWRRQWWHTTRRQIFVWTMIILAVVPLAFFGDPRFKVPVIPFLILLAASLFGPPGTADEPERAGLSRLEGSPEER